MYEDKYNPRSILFKIMNWLVRFYGISSFVGYLIPNPFYENNQFYLKQFSLAWVHSLIIKNIYIQAIQFNQTVQISQFSLL